MAGDWTYKLRGVYLQLVLVLARGVVIRLFHNTVVDDAHESKEEPIHQLVDPGLRRVSMDTISVYIIRWKQRQPWCLDSLPRRSFALLSGSSLEVEVAMPLLFDHGHS